jgi:hypothetical protein
MFVESFVEPHFRTYTPENMTTATVYLCVAVSLFGSNAAALSSAGQSPVKLAGTSARFERFANYLLSQQQSIIETLTDEDGKAVFAQDPWQKQAKADGRVEGYGITAVMQRGDLLEKAAVSTTIVTGRWVRGFDQLYQSVAACYEDTHTTSV